MDILYREGVLADVPVIVNLCNNHGGYDEIDAQVVRTGGTWYVAEVEGEVVACVWFLTDRQHASIDYLAVREDHQVPGAYDFLLMRLKTYLGNQYGIGFYHGLIQLPDGTWVKVDGESYAPLADTAYAFYEQRGLADG